LGIRSWRIIFEMALVVRYSSFVKKAERFDPAFWL